MHEQQAGLFPQVVHSTDEWTRSFRQIKHLIQMWGTRRPQDGKGTSTWGAGGCCARGHSTGLGGATRTKPDSFAARAKTLTVGTGDAGGVSGTTWSGRCLC